DVALDFLLDLVDMTVEHGHRPEALQVAEGARSIFGAPSPILVDRPQWQMGEDYDRRARRAPGKILLHPFELLVAELGEAGGFEPRFEIEDVDEGNKVHTADIEGVPALALSSLAVAVEIGLAVVGIGDVVLAGDHIDLLFERLHGLVGVVELLVLRQVSDV